MFCHSKKETTFALPTEGNVINVNKDGTVAQSVEQWTENPCVAGSIPAHTTLKSFREIWSFFVLLRAGTNAEVVY
jgi:hypothetical protein